MFLFTFYVAVTIVGCASLPCLEKRLLSENDSIMGRARAELDNTWNTQKLVDLSQNLIPKAKYGNQRQSLMAFQALASMYVSGDYFGLRGYSVVGVAATPFTEMIGKQRTLIQQLDDKCIDNYLLAIDNGNPETKIFCIDILSQAQPIYTKTVDHLIKILNSDWENPSYHAYWALKKIGTLQALEATAQYDQVYKKQ